MPNDLIMFTFTRSVQTTLSKHLLPSLDGYHQTFPFFAYRVQSLYTGECFASGDIPGRFHVLNNTRSRSPFLAVPRASFFSHRFSSRPFLLLSFLLRARGLIPARGYPIKRNHYNEKLALCDVPRRGRLIAGNPVPLHEICVICEFFYRPQMCNLIRFNLRLAAAYSDATPT